MTTPDSVLHRQVNGTFIGPVAPHFDQPRPTVVSIDWNAYDVPRLWDMVRREDDDIAWQQARGFENLAQLLLSHHDSLRGQRNSMSDAWSPEDSPAAARFFVFLDALIQSMAENAVAHASTSRGMHAILTALKATKVQVGQLKREWDRVTTDLTPEWWDHAADDLNRRARELMQRTDAAVGDYRRQLVVPALYASAEGTSGMAVPEERPAQEALARKQRQGQSPAGEFTGAGESTIAVAPPPPIPGHDPVMRRGPELQGVVNVPQPVPAAPGSPISLLPVPPGNSYAPSGGAYVLPGPGIGRGRWIYPMPAPAGLSGVGPHAGGLGRRSGDDDAQRPGRRLTVWQIASGVPPVIGAEDLAEEQVRLAAEAFPDWFADLATPWTDDLKVELARTEPGP